MRTLIVLLLACSCSYLAKAQQEIVIDPNAETRTVTGHFHAVKVSGGIDLYLSQSAAEAIAVSGSSDKYRAGISTTVENGVLLINYTGDKMWGLKNKKLKVYVSFRELDRIEAHGACDVLLAGMMSGNKLQLNLSGASDFKGKVKLEELKLDLSGASDVKLSGTTNLLTIVSSGASDVKGYELTAEVCNAKASGASDIHITVNKELSASASGASDISYKGNALLKDNHSSGASSIGKKS